MEDITAGMAMMSEGMMGVRNGMSGMSGETMQRCCSGSQAVLAPMEQAMAEMQQGQLMIADDQEENDSEGMAHLQQGSSTMNTALDQAETAVGCMGHGKMMSGSMH